MSPNSTYRLEYTDSEYFMRERRQSFHHRQRDVQETITFS